MLRRYGLSTRSKRLVLIARYTAADIASDFLWAELHSSERNPKARWTAELVHRVARELKAAAGACAR